MKNFTLKSVIFGSSILLLAACSSSEIETLDEESLLTETTSNAVTHAEEFLDYGLYWFNANNQSFKGYDESTETPISVSTELYDPSKPTLIYFHGWSIGSSVDNYRRGDFQLTDASNDIDVNSARIWKEKGWNVAAFYWNQFADELEIKDAEAKIWSAEGSKGMRYRLRDGSTSTAQSPDFSVSDLAVAQLSELLANNTSGNLRFAGHSLGNQLAVAVAKKMSDAAQGGSIATTLIPNRIELLDPFWSQDGKSYLGDTNNDGKNDWNGERVRLDIRSLKNRHNTAITWYSSSLILNAGIGDRNDALKEEVAFQSVRMWYLNSLQVIEKHNYIKNHYFSSLAYNAPKEVTLNFWRQRKSTGKVAASAAAPNSRITALMDSGYLWDQVEGRFTATLTDDAYEFKKW